MNDAKNVLILTIYGDYFRRVPYYIGLVNYLKLMNNDLKVILVISAPKCTFNGKLTFTKHKNYSTFGITNSTKNNISNITYEYYCKIPHDSIIICPNKGWDIGPLMVGLRYMYVHNIQPEYLINIHSKTNKEWEQGLTKIIRYSIKDFNVDTIVPSNWCSSVYTPSDISSELNIKKIKTLSNNLPGVDFSDVYNWKYVAGKMFITRFNYLKPIVNSFDTLYPILTDKNTDDQFWVTAVKGKNVFNYYYNMYKNNPWNEPINHNAYYALTRLNCKNYFELKNYGYRSIPDLMIEHALERIIGHTILHNSTNILKI